ncbi:dormancy-associated protein homolog 4 isoform X1 [Corylus avellana]|uniref:dormancy-associated protein homolog 4 isoform X1 n=1 Tax=Corylus avellana TaxID=13451 RepID=UPI00286D0332|nr:dormancy-associated protein homolog 4 isoform X1 [Corylus avellana]
MANFLHKLWDETLAGPAPDTGLSKLRKYDSFSATGSPPMVADGEVQVSRSITILRANSAFNNLSVDPGSAPVSPAGSATPRTPLTPETPGVDIMKKYTRRKSLVGALEQPESRSPTAFDWIVISALDR